MQPYSISVLARGYRVLQYEPVLSDHTGTYDIPLGRKLLSNRDIRLFFSIDWEWDNRLNTLKLTKDESDLDLSNSRGLVTEVQEKVTNLMSWALVHKRLLTIITNGALP